MRKIIMWIAIALGACLVLIIIAGILGGGKSGTSMPTSKPAIAVAQVPTLEPSRTTMLAVATVQEATVRPSRTSVPTRTPRPTTMPSPVPDPSQQLAKIAADSCASDKVESVSLDDGAAIVTCNQTLSWDTNTFLLSAAMHFQKMAPQVFAMPGVDTLTLKYFAPFTDKYGKSSSDEGIRIIITRAAADKFQWNNISAKRLLATLVSEPDCGVVVHPALRADYVKWVAGG